MWKKALCLVAAFIALGMMRGTASLAAEANVTDSASYIAALENGNVDVVNIMNDIAVAGNRSVQVNALNSSSTSSSRKTINGGDHTISFGAFSHDFSKSPAKLTMRVKNLSMVSRAVSGKGLYTGLQSGETMVFDGVDFSGGGYYVEASKNDGKVEFAGANRVRDTVSGTISASYLTISSGSLDMDPPSGGGNLISFDGSGAIGRLVLGEGARLTASSNTGSVIYARKKDFSIIAGAGSILDLSVKSTSSASYVMNLEDLGTEINPILLDLKGAVGLSGGQGGISASGSNSTLRVDVGAEGALKISGFALNGISIDNSRGIEANIYGKMDIESYSGSSKGICLSSRASNAKLNFSDGSSTSISTGLESIDASNAYGGESISTIGSGAQVSLTSKSAGSHPVASIAKKLVVGTDAKVVVEGASGTGGSILKVSNIASASDGVLISGVAKEFDIISRRQSARLIDLSGTAPGSFSFGEQQLAMFKSDLVNPDASYELASGSVSMAGAEIGEVSSSNPEFSAYLKSEYSDLNRILLSAKAVKRFGIIQFPELADFGEIAVQNKLIRLYPKYYTDSIESPYLTLKVIDERSDGTGFTHNWVLSAKATPLSSRSHVFSHAVFFGKNEAPLDKASAVVARGPDMNSSGNSVVSLDYVAQDGIFLELNPAYANLNENYSTTITWTLTDSIQ